MSEWSRRVRNPAASLAPLGFPAEYWNSDPKQYEGYDQLDSRLRALGRRPRRSDLAYQLTNHLLDDVLVAAGGVEDSIMRLRVAIAELHSWIEENDLKADVGIPHGLSHATAVTAWYAFSSLLTWGRTVIERMERPPGDRKRFPKQGLVPALRPKRLRAKCERLLADLRASPVGQSRNLANFVLHTALVRHPYAGVQLEPSGSITLPVPELPSQQIAHWYLLSWHRQGDGLALAEEMWKAIQHFVNELIAAFEVATPRRLRRAQA